MKLLYGVVNEIGYRCYGARYLAGEAENMREASLLGIGPTRDNLA